MKPYLFIRNDGKISQIFNIQQLVYAKSLDSGGLELRMSDGRSYTVEETMDSLRDVLETY